MTSEAQFAQTHDEILAAGQRLFRSRGYKGTSLREVMAEAGLTVGGFYAHFGSKAELFQACFDKAGEAGYARLMAGVGKGEFLKPVQRYLSEGHLKAKAEGCPLAAMVSELDQIDEGGPLPGVDAYLERFAGGLANLGADRDRVYALLSLMVGSLTLARAATDPKLKGSLIAQSLQAARSFAAGKNQEKR